jgi:hypothetical protein
MYFNKSLKLVFIGVLWLLLPQDSYAANKRYSKSTTSEQQKKPKLHFKITIPEQQKLPKLHFKLTTPEQQKLPKVFLLDRFESPYAGASWIISTRIWFNELEDRYLLPQNAPSTWLRRWVSAAYNNLANDLLMVTAHEVYGHGFRHRSLGERVVNYQFNVLSFSWLLYASLFPLPGLSASTEGRYSEKLSTIDIRLLGSIGGSQANSVLASELIRSHFSSGVLNHRTANLFFKSFVDLPIYIRITSKNDCKLLSGDIAVYLARINEKHGFEGIKLNDLKFDSFVYLLNPMLYSSIWSFYEYIFGGQKELTIPRLTWKQIAYMPIIRMGLTPFGLTYYLDNYLAIDKQVFSVSLNAGSSPFYSSYYGGLTCQTNNLWSYEAYTVDLTGSVWHQPKLQLKPNSPLVDQNYWGGLIGITTKLQLHDRFSILATIHYKTEGFLEGVVADAALGLRVGLELSY